MDISEIRRENVRLLVEQWGGQSSLAEKLEATPAWLSHILTRRRNLGEAGARSMERKLGLPRDWLDHLRSGIGDSTSFPAELWERLAPDAKSLLLKLAEHLSEPAAAEERMLLHDYRGASPESRAVILAVASAQAAHRDRRISEPQDAP